MRDRHSCKVTIPETDQRYMPLEPSFASRAKIVCVVVIVVVVIVVVLVVVVVFVAHDVVVVVIVVKHRNIWWLNTRCMVEH